MASARYPLLLVAVVIGGCGQYREPRRPQASRPHLTVMSYNVNYGLAGDRTTLEAIGKANADVVLLQETTPAWEHAIRIRFGGVYPHMEFRHCCGAGGLAVLSKQTFQSKQYIRPDREGWFPGWRIVAQTPLGPVQMLNVHLRPAISDSGSVVSGYFTTPEIRHRQIQKYYSRLEPGLPTLVAGDFNEGHGGDAVEYLRARGLESVLPQFDAEQSTWRWRTVVGTISWQLDHIVHDASLDPLDARVLATGRSDHLPVVAVFQRTPPAQGAATTCYGPSSVC